MCFRPPDVTTGPLMCPECGKKIVSPNFTPVACPFCKAPLPSEPEPLAPGMVKCPKCGEVNPITTKTCSGCGASEAEIALELKIPKKPSAPRMPGAAPKMPNMAPKPPGAPPKA